MGVSTDAILYYGVELGSLEESIRAPKDNYGDESWYFVLDKLLQSDPLLAHSTHCHAEHPMFYVHSVHHHKTAWRGSPTEIDPIDLLDPSLTVKNRLKDFAARFEECFGKVDDADFRPGWRLVSYWG